MKSFTKQLLFISMGLAIIVAGAISVWAVNNRGAAPVGWWKFDEGQGASAYDASGNGYTGTITGATWKNEPDCKSGKCLYFDGAADNVAISSSITLSTQFTISHWLRTNASGGQVYTVGNAGGANGYRFGIGGGVVYFLVGNGSVYTETSCGTKTVNDNKWHLITGVFSSANTFTCYIDGQYEAAVAVVDFSGMSTAAPGIGAPPCCTDYQGYIDDVRIYNYARSAAQIKADYVKSAGGKGATMKVGSSQEEQAASEGLVGYWKMDEASWAGAAGEVIDSSGNGNNGTSTNGANTTSTAKFGMAGNFDGVNDYIQLSDTSVLSPGAGNFTMEAWFKTSKNYSVAGGAIYFDYGSDLDNTVNIVVNLDNKVAGSYRDAESDAILVSGQGKTVNDGIWHHVAYVRTSQTTATLYLDGAAIGSATNASCGTITTSDANPPRIGEISFYSAGTNPFQGQIDDVKIYNKARTAEQIRMDYETGPGPVGYWRMDENTGQYAYDTSGDGNTGTLGSSPSADASDPLWAAGKYGSALKFNDSASNYVDCGTSSSLDISNAGITVEAWVYSNTGAYARGFVAKDDLASGRSWYFGMNDSTSFRAALWTTSGRIDISMSGFNLNEWTHVAFTYDGSNEYLYKNGVQSSPVAQTGNIVSHSSTKVTIGSLTGNYFFNGMIDDVRIYNYARTQKQIYEDMNGGHPAVGSPVGSYAGYWPFDEGYGTTTYDKSISHLNGTLSTSTMWSTNGKFGKALSFDGTDDYVDMGDPASGSLDFDTGDFTLSAWIKTSDATNDGAFGRRIISKGYDTGYELILTAGVPWVTVHNIQNTFSNAVSVANGQWRHLVVVADRDANATLYVDGKAVGTLAISSVSGNSISNTKSFMVGNYSGDGGTNGSFNGLIDDVKIYPFALSAAEIKEEYNRGAALVLGATGMSSAGVPSNSASSTYCVPGGSDSCNPPVAHWKMDEKAGQYAYDSSGNGNTGTTSGATWKSAASCKSGACLSFDGTDDYVSVADASSLNPSAAITVEAWFKATDIAGQTNPPVVKKVNGSTGYSLEIGHAASTLAFWVYVSGVGWKSSPTYTVSTNTWYHAVGVFDGSYIRLYVNGTEVSSPTAQAGTLASSSGRPLYIGKDYDNPTRLFEGQIDDVKIYNYARTAAQIAYDYNRGGPVGWWKMDSVGVSGTPGAALNVYDSSPSTGSGQAGNTGVSSGETMNNGTITGATWKSNSNCKYGSCLSFDGSSSYVDMGNNSSLLGLTPSNMTISGWFKVSTAPTSGNQMMLVATRPTSPSNAGYGLLYYNNSGTYQIYIAFWAGYTGYANYTLTPGTWYHIVGTFSNNVGAIYINGVAQSTTNTGSGYTAATDHVYLGKWNYSGSAYLNGAIDDVRIYNAALSATQVAALYNNDDRTAGAGLEDNLVGEWLLNENGGSYVADTHYLRDGKWGYAMNFDGTDDYVLTSANNSVKGLSQATVSVWVKINTLDGNAHTIYVEPRSLDASARFAIDINTDNKIRFAGRSPDSDSLTNWVVSTKTLSTGIWYHLVGVFNSDTDIHYLYINGVAESATVSDPAFDTSAPSSAPRIGLNALGSYPFSGLIDDIRIYNYGLTATQVKTLFNQGAAVRFGPSSGLP